MIPGGDARQAALTTQRQPPPLLLAPVGDKTVERDFAGGRFSADAGLVVRKDIDAQRGLTRALAAVRAAAREARRLHFPPAAFRKQRIFPIAAGDEEAHDANPWRHAPLFTLLRDRVPEPGAPWASQPPLSRFETRVSHARRFRAWLSY